MSLKMCDIIAEFLVQRTKIHTNNFTTFRQLANAIQYSEHDLIQDSITDFASLERRLRNLEGSRHKSSGHKNYSHKAEAHEVEAEVDEAETNLIGAHPLI